MVVEDILNRFQVDCSWWGWKDVGADEHVVMSAAAIISLGCGLGCGTDSSELYLRHERINASGWNYIDKHHICEMRAGFIINVELRRLVPAASGVGGG